MHAVVKTAMEAAVLMSVAVGLAFGGNSIVKNPVDLHYNYYRGSLTIAKPTKAIEPEVIPRAADPVRPADAAHEAPNNKIGNYELIDIDEVKSLSAEDVDFALIIDARKHESYEKSHIPGAYTLDYYRLKKDMIDAIRDKLDAAALVILYCNGGNCEDSLNLAASLEYDYQVERAKLRIFEAGFEGWEKAKLPTVNGSERR